ncbi:MAG: hypothetical protein RL194_1445 [Pseudomonadota bacterium]
MYFRSSSVKCKYTDVHNLHVYIHQEIRIAMIAEPARLNLQALLCLRLLTFPNLIRQFIGCHV